MTDSSAVTHAQDAANIVIQKYIRAFDSEASIIVAPPARLELLRAHPRIGGWYATDCATHFEKLPGAPAAGELVIETSGTAGEPKMVRYTKETIRNCAMAIARHLPLRQERRYVALVNPRLAYGMSIIHSHTLAGVPVRFQPAPVSLDAWTEFHRSLSPQSSVYLVPHQSFLLAREPRRSFDGPIELIFAGGVLTNSMAANLRLSFPNAAIVNMYGQAELGPRISIGRSPVAEFCEGDVGKPLPGVQVRIAAGAETGIVEVASPYRMAGYFDVDGHDEPAPPAWWPTGDVGSLGPDGHLHVTGRDAPDLNFMGSRIELAVLRRLVRGVDGVLDCRVGAVEHPVYGQQPTVRVLTRAPDATAERRVRQVLAAEIGSGASAVAITVVDLASLPESGKL